MRLLAFALFVLLVGCKKDEDKSDPLAALLDAMPGPTPSDPNAMEKGAREEFGTQFHCKGGIVAKRRNDLEDAQASDHKRFETTGCGQTAVIDCRPHHAHGAVYPDWADCSVVK